MTFIIRIAIVLLPITLMGCLSSQSILRGQKHYLYATSVPPLRIPPGVASSQLHNYYPVSYTQYSESAKDVSLVPPGLMDK